MERTPIGGPKALSDKSIDPEAIRTDSIGSKDEDVITLVAAIDADGHALSNVANLNEAGGFAGLDNDGQLFNGQVPELAITETYTVADKPERIALSEVEEGDVAVQQDTDEAYMYLGGGDPSDDANWSLISTYTVPVTSVHGRTGDISAQDGDYEIGQLDSVEIAALLEGADADKPAPGTSGRYYYATDVDLLYRDDGTSWVVTAGHGSQSMPVPSFTADQITNSDYSEAVQSLSGSGSITVDLSAANMVEIAATGDVSIDLTNVSENPPGNSVLIYFSDNGGGPHSISWPASVVWSGGSAVGEIPGGSNIEVSLVSYDGGTEWRGRLGGSEFA